MILLGSLLKYPDLVGVKRRFEWVKIVTFYLVVGKVLKSVFALSVRGCVYVTRMYSNQEMADMHLTYGLAECNSADGRCPYSVRYLNRRLPDKKTFQRLNERLRETGSFKNRELDDGRPMNVSSIN